MKLRKAITNIGLLFTVSLSLSACVGGSSDSSDASRFGDVPVAYVMRVTPLDEDGTLIPNDLGELAEFHPGARLMIRDAASPQANETDVTSRLFDGLIDVRDLSVSPDGRQLLFALREPEIEDADEDEQPTWNIWLLDRETGAVNRVIINDLVAEEGQDIQPTFLPDGRILFVSNRQRQSLARLLDEGKPQFTPQEEESRRADAYSIHVMNADGTEIRQVTFNMSHDLWPQVMADGTVLFLRWDAKAAANEFNLYRITPDGREVSIMFGGHSHDVDDPDQVWSRPRVLADGRVLLAQRPLESDNWSISPILFDVANFSDLNQPLPGFGGTAEAEPLPVNFSSDVEQTSAAGRLAALTPLLDGTGRYIAAYSSCRLRRETGTTLFACTDDNLASENLIEAPPSYGLWIVDPYEATQRPVRLAQVGEMITDVAVLRAGLASVALADGQPGLDLDQDLYDRLSGVIDIRSVYDFAGAFDPLVEPPTGVDTLEEFRDPGLVTADQRVVRFLRITKGVLLPDRDFREIDPADIGRVPGFGMREIVGYVPVQPDGSVRVEVPANVPLGLQLTDARGRSLSGFHGGWLSVRPGETLTCNGCHNRDDETPHGRPEAEPVSANPGAPVTGLPFNNTDPALFADAGDTMAQLLTRLQPDRLMPSPDLVFEDVWTDPAVRTPDDAFTISYNDLDTERPIPTPVSGPDCIDEWTPLCRTVIHYLDHIQPIWELPRMADVGGMMTDVTCSGCHSRRDDMNDLQIPPAQLELTGEVSGEEPDNIVSYRELVFDDFEQDLVDGALVDRLDPVLDELGNPVFETNELGELILDEFGDPIPVRAPVTLTPPMVAGSALLSRFFDTFATDGAHEGWLTEAELRLLHEWLDIGGQYYNDPFAVPQ